MPLRTGLGAPAHLVSSLMGEEKSAGTGTSFQTPKWSHALWNCSESFQFASILFYSDFKCGIERGRGGGGRRAPEVLRGEHELSFELALGSPPLYPTPHHT